jgi:PAP2 superfamily
MTGLNISTGSKTQATPSGRFMPAEWLLLGLLAAICVSGVASAILAQQAVDWLAFFPAFGASIALMLIGAHVRARKNMPRLALGTIGFGVFMCFMGSISIFIFTLFPLEYPLIDLALISTDAAIGYVWVDFVQAISHYPIFGKALGYVYLSSLPQMVAVILLLAFLNRANDLHRFLTVGVLSLIVTVAFWWLFPSIGPAAYSSVPPAVQAKIGLVVNAEYGAELRQLAADGLAVITLERIIGVIAFPSFHIVMACMVVWFTRRTLAFTPALLANIAMVPATLSHGGHHLIDVVGGVVTFAICLWIVIWMLPDVKTARTSGT